MNISAQFVFFWPSRAFVHAAATEVRQSGEAVDIEEIWPEVRRRHAGIPPPAPGNSLGVRLLMRYLRWNLALYRTLQEQGMAQSAVLALIERIQWRIVEPVSATPFRLSRLRSAALAKRIRWTVDLLFRTLFTQPFERVILPSEKGAVFNVTRCPFADYLREQGAPELTGAALCALDKHMARQWGIGFERTMTLAEGKSHCDFKFVVPIKPVPADVSRRH